MEKGKNKKLMFFGITAVLLFIAWTAAISFIDVGAIGPLGSSVGFSSFNRFIHELAGVHMKLYIITDWLGLIPICFMVGFALLGFTQMIGRKSIFKVDRNIILLGVFYLAVAAIYYFFEINVINYRPVLIEGVLEASYPSSTTLLVMCVMPTSAMQINSRIKKQNLKKAVLLVIRIFTVFMVIGRLVSGVHWFTDIIGGIILSAGLVSVYSAAAFKISKIKELFP